MKEWSNTKEGGWRMNLIFRQRILPLYFQRGGSSQYCLRHLLLLLAHTRSSQSDPDLTIQSQCLPRIPLCCLDPLWPVLGCLVFGRNGLQNALAISSIKCVYYLCHIGPGLVEVRSGRSRTGLCRFDSSRESQKVSVKFKNNTNDEKFRILVSI